MKKQIVAALLIAGILSSSMMSVSAMPQSVDIRETYVEKISQKIGEEYDICPELLQAIAYKESSYMADAEYNGCSGLMQISGKWHKDRMKRLKVTDLYDPEENMLVAADYLMELSEKYEDIGMVLMVYNGDSTAEHYYETGEGLSQYAEDILTLSEQLEREHGK